MLAAVAVPTSQLDRDNPWPGLESFEEDARDYFHGREAEADELLRRVTDAPLTVLFGKSGLGKTSLLKAGLFPRLREKHFLPVHLRLDIRPDAPGLIDQLRDGLRVAIERESVDAPPFAPGETLWEYLHRADLELWSAQNHLLTPVLVLDQFEEVFTLGERFPEIVKRFQIDLGDLAENRIPEALADRLAADASRAQQLDLRRMAYKLIVTLREDFLPHLEAWRAAVPSLGRVRLRLLPMRPDQALSAVYDTAPHLMDEPLARRIVAFVAAAQSDGAAQEASASGEIEPSLLSLFCRGLNEQRKRLGKDRFDEQLLEGAQQSIIADYYRSCVEGLPDSVSRFIETDLITEKGFRNSYAKDDAVPSLLTREQLDRLINRRLLRLEERYGTARIELTHDLLTRAVKAHRDRRRLEEEKAALEAQAWRQRRRVVALALIALICLAFAGIAAWQWREAVTAKTAAEKATQKAQEEEGRAKTAETEAQSQAWLARESAKRELDARKKADEARARAEADRSKALEAQRSSLSAKLASDSRAERDQALDLSFLLGAAAWSVNQTPEASSVLLSNLLNQPALRGILPSFSAVSVIAFSPDGRTLAMEVGRSVFLWDIARRALLDPPLNGFGFSITSMAFSPDGQTLAAGSFGWAVALWDVPSRQRLGGPLGERGSGLSVAFSPDGKILATGNQDGTITLWDIARRTVLGKPLNGHELGVESLAFSPDGKTLASGSADKTVLLWDIPSHQPLSEPLAGHQGSVTSVAFSSDGRTLAAGGANTTVLLWDVESRTGVREPRAARAVGEPFVGQKDAVKSIALSHDGKLALGTEDGTVTLWDVASHTALGEPLDGHKGSVLSLAFSTDGKTLAAGSRNGSVLLWDVAGRTALAEPLVGPRGPVSSVAFSPDGKIIAAGTWDKSVVLWDAANRQRLGAPLLSGHQGPVQGVAFSPDGKIIAAGSEKAVILWDVARHQPLGDPLAEHKGNVSSVAFSPDGRTLASGSEDETVIFWDATNRKPVGKPLAGHGGAVRSVAFNPDGKTLAAGVETGAIILWDVARRMPLGKPLADRGRDSRAGRVLSLAFSPDGTTLAAGRKDGSVDLWDVVRHASLGSGLGRPEIWIRKKAVESVSFSPDGKTLASGNADGTVILWDVKRRTRLGETMVGHKDRVQSVSFSPDGKTLASGSADGTILLWDVDPDSWSRRACFIASRNLTCEEWRRYLLDEPYRKICPDLRLGPKSCD